jgi:hypothetical protein
VTAIQIAYARALAGAILVAFAAGCATAPAGGKSAHGGHKPRGTKKARQPESLQQANARLEAEVEQLRRERERLAQSNAILQDELAWAHEDFKLVENQFVAFEEQMASNYGKASAVTAAAEARIRYDHMQRERLFAATDTTAAHVLGLINTAERLIRDQSYTAALFFAERADHMMSGAERRMRLGVLPTTVSVVVDTANLRDGPGQDYEVIERVSQAAALTCLDLAGEWYRVRATTGTEGWIHVSLVR